jgi:hypothetical protein
MSAAKKPKDDSDETFSAFDGSDQTYAEDSNPSLTTEEEIPKRSVLDEAFDARTVVHKRPGAPPRLQVEEQPPEPQAPPPQQPRPQAKQTAPLSSPTPSSPQAPPPVVKAPKTAPTVPSSPVPSNTMTMELEMTKSNPGAPRVSPVDQLRELVLQNKGFAAVALVIVLVFIVLAFRGGKKASLPQEDTPETYSAPEPQPKRNVERSLTTQHVLEQFDQAFGQTQSQVQLDPYSP